MRTIFHILVILGLTSRVLTQAGSQPIVSPDLVFEEKNGVVAVEAEHFYQQDLTRKRAWRMTTPNDVPLVEPDGDEAHLPGASGGAYLEILPDSRRNHSEKLIHGENFSNTPGKLGILHYKIHFETTGRYYVWVRAYSSGSEDNGIHVGLDGSWPESGQRMQWCEGKRTWRWESKQRTQEQHCGEPYKIYLDIENKGTHDIMFSMREDGFEFDKFILTQDRNFQRPSDAGPTPRVKAGTLPQPFAAVGEVGGAQVDSSTGHEVAVQDLVGERLPDGDGSVNVTGELRQWHNVILTLNGPYAHEKDDRPNPFTDHRFMVRFVHESGSPDCIVPGYFAADGDAANTSADSGTQWRAHLSPDKTGKWTYTISFLPYNSGGDGDNVWPFVERMGKLHYDVSKLAQWEVVFDHGTNKGLHLHFKLQENEIDDNRRGHEKDEGTVPESFDGGTPGVERKLYCRELITRFAHHLALNWDIVEENTQSIEEINDMVDYLKDVDPYDHNIVIHTFPSQQDLVYTPLLGEQSRLTGASLQNSWSQAHQRTLKWRQESSQAGKPWVVVIRK